MDWMNVRSPFLKVALPVVSVLAASPVWSAPLSVDSHSAKDLESAVAAQGVEQSQEIGKRLPIEQDSTQPSTQTQAKEFTVATAAERKWEIGSDQWALGSESWSGSSEPQEEMFPTADVTAASPPDFIQSAESWKETLAQVTETKPEAQTNEQPINRDRSSPVLEKWQKQVPNVLEDIRRDPSFRTRIRLGLSYFPSTFNSLGWNVGVEDIFLFKAGWTGMTISGDYQATFTGARQAGGAELRYYVLPLGGYFNLAPVFGYRYLQTTRYVTSGLNVGFRVQAILSRTGAADISLEQTWVAPQQSNEVGLTRLSFGFALTRNLRMSTDVDWQNSKQKKDNRYGISLEWMF